MAKGEAEHLVKSQAGRLNKATDKKDQLRESEGKIETLGGWKAQAEVAERNNERLSNRHLIGESRALNDETCNKRYRKVLKNAEAGATKTHSAATIIDRCGRWHSITVTRNMSPSAPRRMRPISGGMAVRKEERGRNLGIGIVLCDDDRIVRRRGFAFSFLQCYGRYFLSVRRYCFRERDYFIPTICDPLHSALHNIAISISQSSRDY